MRYNAARHFVAGRPWPAPFGRAKARPNSLQANLCRTHPWVRPVAHKRHGPASLLSAVQFCSRQNCVAGRPWPAALACLGSGYFEVHFRLMNATTVSLPVSNAINLRRLVVLRCIALAGQLLTVWVTVTGLHVLLPLQ